MQTDEQLHLVLGGSGAIGNAVIRELDRHNIAVRALERTKTVDGVETINADLLDLAEAKKAIKGFSHVHLCIGLPYSSEVWLSDWPRIMRNIIEICSQENVRLIFFDNVYMYGPPPLPLPFDEASPQNPTSKKGKARKETADMLLEAIASGKLEALIARSADFYGPGAVHSQFYMTFLQRMLESNAPRAISSPGIKHTYAYTVDNARAMVRLALDDSAYGEVWHLPVGEPITMEEIAELFNKELGTDYKVRFIPSVFQALLSLFIPELKEAREMLFQFNKPYIMSFEKFRRKYPDIKVTPYEKGIKEMVRSFRVEDNRIKDL